MQGLIYLDHHATTPCDSRVVDAMLPYFTERFGNAASRTHVFGLQAKAATEIAREQLAAVIGASPKEIVWTSGATEADNLAILGIASAWRERGRHIVTVATEHKAVLDPCAFLARQGYTVTVLPVGPDGRVHIDEVAAALRDDTILVTVMLANNEIGTIQPIEAIGALCRERGIPFHSDAVQALGRVPIDVGRLGCDLMSLSAHKLYGPKGIGALYVRRGRPRVPIEPILHGGGHERGLRPGTLAVPLIVGFGVAADLARQELQSGAIAAVHGLRDRLLNGLRARVEGVTINGSLEHRLPNNLNCSFDGVEAEALLMSMKEVALSSGSACTSATLEPSHVLRALGIGDRAHGSVRFGIGRTNTEAEIDHVVERIAALVPKLRAMNAANDTPILRTVVWSPGEPR